MAAQDEKLPQVSGMRLLRRISAQPNTPLGKDGRNTANSSSKVDRQDEEAQPKKQAPSADIIIGKNEETGDPITVSQVDLCRGGYLLGMPGVGKTSELISLAIQQLRIGGSVFVIDPTMDMINAIIARMPEHRVKDTYLLDLTNHKRPFDLNVFNSVNKQGLEAHVTVLRQSMKAFEKLWPEVGSQINFSNVLYPIIETILAVPDLSLAHAKRLLLDDGFRHGIISRLSETDADIETLSFWEEYNRLSHSDRKDLLRAFLGRLTKLLRDPYVKYIISQTDTPEDNKNVDLREAIIKGRNILVHLPVDNGAYEEAAKFIGTFFMMQFYEAIFSFRKDPPHKRPGCMFIVDEFENFAFAGKDFEGIYSKARKYGCKLILAHQHRGQLHDESMKVIRDATTGANLIICFMTNDKDGPVMGSLFSGYHYYDENAADDKYWEEEDFEEEDEGEFTRKPTNYYVHPLDWLEAHRDLRVKDFYLRTVLPLQTAAKMRIAFAKDTQKEILPIYNFGFGQTTFRPENIQHVLNRLNSLLYYTQVNQWIDEDELHQFVSEIYRPAIGSLPFDMVPDPDGLSKRKELQSAIDANKTILKVLERALEMGSERIAALEKEIEKVGDDAQKNYDQWRYSGYNIDWTALADKYHIRPDWFHVYNLRYISEKTVWFIDRIEGTTVKLKGKDMTRQFNEIKQLREIWNSNCKTVERIKESINSLQWRRDAIPTEKKVERIDMLERFEQTLRAVLEILIDDPLAADKAEVERERERFEKEQERKRLTREKREREQRKREWERERNAHKTLSAAQVSELLPKLPAQHAFVKVRGAEIYRMGTVDINEYYPAVHYTIADQRKNKIIAQTIGTYCRGRKEVAAQINTVYRKFSTSGTLEEDAPLQLEASTEPQKLPSGETGRIKRTRQDFIEE